jgi:hypothetical protein
MNIRIEIKDNENIAVISSEEVIINNGQEALDLIARVRYDYGCNKMIINKKNINEDFFELKNGIAGEIMQKYINYGMSLGIVGEFEQYSSKSVKALIYESNKGNKIIFKNTFAEALESLSRS